MILVAHVARMSEMRYEHIFFIWRTGPRWEDTRMDLRRNRAENCGMDSTGSRLEQVAGPCENNNEPSPFITGREYDWVNLSFSRRTQPQEVSQLST